jgi:transcriptional regulator with XRE-family HTH domain
MIEPDARRATFEWIGKRLRWAREQIPLTQTEFARALGITTVTLSKAESGQRTLSILSVITAANRLRCGTEYLLTGDLVAVEPELRERLILAHPELLRPEGREARRYVNPADPEQVAQEEAEREAEREQIRQAMKVLERAVSLRPRRRRRRASAEASSAFPPGPPDTGTPTL